MSHSSLIKHKFEKLDTRFSEAANIFPFLAPLKGRLYTLRVSTTPHSPVEVYFSEASDVHCAQPTAKLLPDAGRIPNVSTAAAAAAAPRKSKPTRSGQAPSKSPDDRTASRSSNNYSPSSNASRSPRPKSKMSSSSSCRSSRSPQSLSEKMPTVLDAETIAAAASKRQSRKGLDVSPAMLEFFGMKAASAAAVGPHACFQVIEKRAPRQNITGRYAPNNESAVAAAQGKQRNGSKEERGLFEPGPEHVAEPDAAQDSNGYAHGEGPVCVEEEGERGEEPARRLLKNGRRGMQPDEPGPEQVAKNIDIPPGTHVIDGTGKALMPAGIDIHNDFSWADSTSDLEAHSRAALAGGTATIIGVLEAAGANETLLAAYDRLSKAATSKSCCNIAFSAVVSEWNESTKKDMDVLVHKKGVNSFLINIQRDEQLFEVFDYCRNLRVLARFVPENRSIISMLENRLRACGIKGAQCFLLSRPQADSLYEIVDVKNLCYLRIWVPSWDHLENEPFGESEAKVNNDELKNVEEADITRTVCGLAARFDVTIPTVLDHLN
ncbi:unnamed protein product [Gongylonema pulchrum]|uniref:Photolyase/cryptochrome alpha/beta domain-containing protein n=1 Tax=Gongylonema pulchrum TaxID=637853 RepID=A0A183DZD4_9BILA|nr:unnamed protein product [Gongylonema pulchrum]